jgi:hypothetical protein
MSVLLFNFAVTLMLQFAPAPGQDVQEQQAIQNRERLEREREDALQREELAPRQGERLRKDQVAPRTAPLARINNRVANRLDTRLRTRQERTISDGRGRLAVSGDTLNDPNNPRRVRR